MKLTCLISLALFSVIKLTAQDKLAMLYSSAGMEYGKANAVDADNNYINTTLFQNTINVNPSGTTNLTCAGAGIDVGLTKYNSQGQLLWGKRFGGAACTEVPHGVDTDAAKNIYVTGFFGSTTLTGPLNGDFNPNGGGTLTTKGSEDVFLAKYDENGNYIWAFGLGNSASETRERGWDLVVDAAGNSYLAGGFMGTVDFNPLGTPNIVTLPGALTGLFIAKYNTSGILQWVIPVNGQLNDIFTEGYATIDFDANGNLFVAGNFRGSNVNVNPNGTASLLNSTGNCDIFIASYSTATGVMSWVKQIGTFAQELVSPGALRCDNNGNPYFTGRVGGMNSVDFDPSAGVVNVTNSALYIASYDINGNLRYAKGMNSGTGDGGHRINFDNANNVYIAGWMNGTATFGTINRTANSTTADVFLAKYNNDLTVCEWALNFGGSGSSDNNICAGLIIDQQNNPIITGQLYGINADVDPSATVLNLSSVGNNDCFVVKYTSAGLLWTSGVVPINLISFSGINKGSENIIEWATASEQDNMYFELERSKDGINFENLATIPGAGVSNIRKNYSHIDEVPFANSTFYRLKQTDGNGQATYSGIIRIRTSNNKPEITLFPNPASDFVNIAFGGNNSERRTVEVYDVTGRVLLKTTMRSSNEKIGIAHLLPGVYYISVVYGGQKSVKSFTKL